MTALAERNKAIRRVAERITRDAGAEITPTAAREYAELDLIVCELWAARKIDPYLKAAKLRFDMAVRMRLYPALYRPATSISDSDDPAAVEMAERVEREERERLQAAGVID